MDPHEPAAVAVPGAPRRTPRWRRVVAFVATFLYPGISQADDGEFRRGCLWYLGLNASGIAGVLLMCVTLDRPWLSMGLAGAVLVAGFGLTLRLAVDGYRRERTPERRGSAKRAISIYAIFFLAGVGFTVMQGTVRKYLVNAYRLSSISMEPTVMRGDRFLADRSAYVKGRHPKPGDVVILIFPGDQGKDFLKRVVAVPGDTVEIRRKKLMVNGKEVREDYARKSGEEKASIKGRDNMKSVRLAEGKYFVLGDNRDRSYDSRFFGPIDEKDFLGKAAYVYFSGDLGRIGKKIR